MKTLWSERSKLEHELDQARNQMASQKEHLQDFNVHIFP